MGFMDVAFLVDGRRRRVGIKVQDGLHDALSAAWTKGVVVVFLKMERVSVFFHYGSWDGQDALCHLVGP